MALIDYPPFKKAHAVLHKVWSKTGNLNRFGEKCLLCGCEYSKEDWKALEKAIDELGRRAMRGGADDGPV